MIDMRPTFFWSLFYPYFAHLQAHFVNIWVKYCLQIGVINLRIPASNMRPTFFDTKNLKIQAKKWASPISITL